MKIFFLVLVITFPFVLKAQQNAVVISRCGGVDTVVIPSIVDNDHDGMDDALEQKLLNHFMPDFIQFDDESCPGPALNGMGDSNLVVCHIYPYPAQYTQSNNPNSVLIHPSALVPSKGLVAGMIWYNPLIMVNAALLYGKDCGLLGHTADVEGFSFSLKYTGADSLSGWMYDTTLTHWMGGTIQTVSHAGTLCEHVETSPYRSAQFPNGLNTVYASPDKHGNYLTISGCGSSIICNPGCGGTQSLKSLKAVNIGEPNASLVSDLGNIYPAYAGNDPWGTANFLDAQGGNAGAIVDKMIKTLTTDFIQGQTLTAPQICPLYAQCFGASGFSYSDHSCAETTYSFFNQQITASGTYNHTLTNSYGCDSIVELMLMVIPTSVQSYNVTVCEGDSYDFNGQPLTVSGVYSDTIISSFGCDSMVTLTFNVDSLPEVTWSQSVDTLFTDGTPVALTGGTPAGGFYSGEGVSGSDFYPDSAGAGSHIITYTYSDSLDCADGISKTFIVIDVSGIKETGERSILLYPNPARSECQLVFPGNTNFISMAIYDARGALIKRCIIDSSTSIDISELPEGFYLVELVSTKGVVLRKLVVE